MKETITTVRQGAGAVAISADRNNKQAIFKDCVLFSDCVRKMNKTKMENSKGLDVAIPIYNLKEYSNNYSKTPGSLR